MSKTPIKNNSLLSDELVAVAADGTRITGILNAQWIKELYNPSGTEVSGSIPVTVSELGSGHYRVTWTPDALGSWSVSLRNAANDLDFAANYESYTGVVEDVGSVCHIAVAYNDAESAEQILISAWLDRGGAPVLVPTTITITWYNQGGTVLFTKTQADAEITGPDAQGVWLLGTNAAAYALLAKTAYYVRVSITDGSGTVVTTRGVPTAG